MDIAEKSSRATNAEARGGEMSSRLSDDEDDPNKREKNREVGSRHS